MQAPPPPPSPPQPPMPHQRFEQWFGQLSRRTKIIGCGVLLLIGASCIGISAIASTGNQVIPVAIATNTPAPIVSQIVPTNTPTQAPTATDTPTIAATDTPTNAVTPTTGTTNMTITHGTPHLGGPVSDFYGKYGSHIFGTVQSDTAPNGSPEESVGWITDSTNAYLLAVHYYTPSNVVNYITYSGPTDWSKAQYRDFMLTFAPPGTVENIQANRDWQQSGGDPYNPIAYDSDIGKFFIHVNPGVADMNTV